MRRQRIPTLIRTPSNNRCIVCNAISLRSHTGRRIASQLQRFTRCGDPNHAICVQLEWIPSIHAIHDGEGRDKHRARTEVMMRTNREGVANAEVACGVKSRIAKVSSAVGLASVMLTLAGCAYEAPPQPRLPYRGIESTNPAYRSADPNCGPPPYAPGSACSPYAAPAAPVPNTDAYGRPYPPTDPYGRPYPTDAQGRPYPPPPPPPAYRESIPADGVAAPENGSATAH